MRRPKAEFQGPGVTLATTITIPLKGRRRALGTIVLDDLRIEAGSDLDVLDAADELGRQVSGAIENVQLLEEVLRSRRATRNEPFATGTETTDLIAVCDARLRLVDVNHALAERLGITRKQAAGRYLVDCIGLQAASWIRALDLWGTSASSDTFSRELDDAILNGRFSFTISALLGTEGDPQGAVLVARQVP
jgi:PAS domain-containing protein